MKCDHFLTVCAFRNLTQMEQWRSLVSDLISVCYRMSDVVSPVVQSSSPEGLIPMDSDSGNSLIFLLTHCSACFELDYASCCYYAFLVEAVKINC